MPKPKTWIPKTSTATEHATSSSQLDPATSTDDVSLGSLTGLPKSASKLQATASEDGLFLGDADLEKIAALLLWMAQDFQPSLDVDDIHYAALEAIMKCNDVPTGGTLGLLHTASIKKLAEIIDIMVMHKDGSPKDANATLQFMRRCAGIRDELLLSRLDREQIPWCRNPRGDMCVELDEADVSLCYQWLGRNLLTHDLRTHQQNDRRYRPRNNFEGDTFLSTFQRSFVGNMLRKNLGDQKVATLIWQHGLPSIAVSRATRPPGAFKVLDLRMLQSSLHDCLQWYITLANDILVHQTQPEFDVHLSLGSNEEEEQQRQQTRREALQKARDALRHGAILAKQRDKKKRTYDDMDDAEQKMMLEYETGRAEKAKQGFTVPRMKQFRCQPQIPKQRLH